VANASPYGRKTIGDTAPKPVEPADGVLSDGSRARPGLASRECSAAAVSRAGRATRPDDGE